MNNLPRVGIIGGGIFGLSTALHLDKRYNVTLEWKDFKKAIKGNKGSIDSGHDGYEANRIVDAIYSSSNLRKPISMA